MTQPEEDVRAHEESVLRAVADRLLSVAPVLGLGTDYPHSGDAARDAALLMDRATAAVAASGGEDRLWLLLVAVLGRLPLEQDVLRLRRRLELDRSPMASRWLLEPGTWPAVGPAPLRCRLVTDQLVVDTGHTATDDLMTGIQRVVREVVRRWDGDPGVVFAAWTAGQAAMRSLSDREQRRVARWGELHPTGEPETEDERAAELLVPWHTTLFMPEVPPELERLARLRAFGRFSGSRLVALGHDTIPVSNQESVGTGLANLFAHYLGTVKHAELVVTVSESAAAEFRGFSRSLLAQGSTGPRVRACLLPAEVPPAPAPLRPEPGPPLVLCVGTLEPRKNQLTLLHAAEVLWREGHDFRLVLLGKLAGGMSDRLLRRVGELQEAGRPLEVRSGVDDAGVWRAYREARFTVQVSTHEGFGLPVAESLASGTPTVTSSHGSPLEAAAGGGALLVDPDDDDAVVDAVRSLLVDEALHARLQAEARSRPSRTWDDYAAQLWDLLHDDARPEHEEVA